MMIAEVPRVGPGRRLAGTAQIHSAYKKLAPAEQRVADYVLSHVSQVLYQSVTQLAQACGVSESTIIRFCRAAGYRGYQELKLCLAREQGEQPGNVSEGILASDSLATVVQKVSYANLTSIQDTLRVLDLDQLHAAIQTLCHAERVEFFGVGASGNTALDAKYKFLRIGIRCDALTDPHLQAMAAATLSSRAVVVGVSHSGSTKDVVDSCAIAKKAGATIIAITDYAQSPITAVADITLLTSSKETPLQSGALRSKIAQLHVLDLLWTGVVMQLGERAQQFTEKTAEAVVDKLY